MAYEAQKYNRESLAKEFSRNNLETLARTGRDPKVLREQDTDVHQMHTDLASLKQMKDEAIIRWRQPPVANFSHRRE